MTDPTHLEAIALTASHAELLDADACAFLLCIRDRAGAISRRGFLERVAVRGSVPKSLQLGGEKKWKREEVTLWAEAERKMANR